MVYDQAQSARIGQKVPIESTFVQVFDVDPSTPTADLVEAAWPGMLIFRNDTSQLMIFDGVLDGWREVAGGVAGSVTYVGVNPPTGGVYNIGDTWYDQDAGMKPYVWDGDSWEPTAGGIKSFRQPAIPTSTTIGDIWYDSDDGNKMYRANAVNVSVVAISPGLGWILVRDDDIDTAVSTANTAAANAATATANAAAAQEAASLAYATADAAASEAADAQTIANAAQVDADAAVIAAANAQIDANQAMVDADAALADAAAAINAADAAQTTASGKANIFYQANAPTAGMVAEDLWVDTDNGVLSVYQGGTWHITQDTNLLAQANTHSDAQASAAQAAAIASASADATTKANAAESDAILAAATDATTKAAAAQAVAIAQASTDATSKANAAQAAATAVANTAQTTANTAIANASAAQSTADEKVQSFFQTTAPTGMVAGDVGDLWFDTDDVNKMYRWDGSAWVLADDQRIAQTVTAAATANTAAGNAQTTANSKIVTFYTTAPPTATTIGDLWVDTDDGNKLYRASAVGAGSWVSVQDTSIASASAAASAAQTAATNAMTAAQTAQATADGAIRTYYDPNPPWANGATGHVNDAGDMWFDTDDGQAYRWNDTTKTWTIIEDSSIAAALAAAQSAQTTADGKVTAYYATTAPWSSGHATDVGDLWYDTGNSNRAYFWTGSAWELVQTTVITNAANTAQSNAIAAAATDATTKAGTAQSTAISTAASDATTKAANAQSAAIASANSFTNAKFPITTTQITDDAITTPKLEANAITAKHTITGPLIQTVATLQRGIKMTSTGLIVYTDGTISGGPAAGTAMLAIDAAGSINMRGSLTSGSTVTGANVVGGLIKTEPTLLRGIELSSGGFIAYNTSGVAQFTINATTGDVSLAGALQGGGTIVGPTFKTTTNINRGVQINSAGLIGFDAAGASMFVLNAATGAITMVGPIQTGGTITGAMFQTHATGVNQGMKLGPAGMTFYTPAGAAVLDFNASTGALTVTGPIVSGASITGATLTGNLTVTGGTLQTDPDASEGIKISSSGLIAYNTTDHLAKFTVDGATGNVALAGTLTGGGYIYGPEFKTDLSDTRGIHLKSAGMYGYDAAGLATFALNGADGALSLKGAINSGSTITGTKVIGTGIQTDMTPGVGLELTSGGLAAFAPGDTVNPSVFINSLTGEATFKGGVFSGGRVQGSRLEIGNITIDPTTGINYPGRMVVPADLTQPSSFTGGVNADWLTSRNLLTMYGANNNIRGNLNVAGGIIAPTSAPGLTGSHQLASKHDMAFGAIDYGMTSHLTDSSVLLVAQAFYGGGIVGYSKTVSGPGVGYATANANFGAIYKPWCTDFNILGGITTAGGYYWVLGRDDAASRGSAQGGWYLYKLDASFNKVGENAVGLPGSFTWGHPTLGSDATYLYCAFTSPAGNDYFTINRVALTDPNLGVAGQLVFVGWITPHTFPGSQGSLSYIGVGNFDFGAPRIVWAHEGNLNFVTDNTGNRMSDVNAFPPALGGTVRGMWWSGTEFWSMNTDGSIVKHGKNLTAQATTGSYTWYDGDTSSGSTVHESLPSPVATYTIQPRSYVVLQTAEAPDSGQLDNTKRDKANRVGIYMGIGAAARRLQTQITSSGYLGVTGPGGSQTGGLNANGSLATGAEGRTLMLATTDLVTSAGQLEPASNGFITAADNPPGQIQSSNYVAGTSGWQLRGDGVVDFGAGSLVTWRSLSNNQVTLPAGYTTIPFKTDRGGSGITLNADGSVTVITPGVYHAAVSVEFSGGPGYLDLYLRQWRSGSVFRLENTVGNIGGWDSVAIVGDFLCQAGDILEVAGVPQSARGC